MVDQHAGDALPVRSFGENQIVTVFMGNQGSGKTTLTNNITGENLETGDRDTSITQHLFKR